MTAPADFAALVQSIEEYGVLRGTAAKLVDLGLNESGAQRDLEASLLRNRIAGVLTQVEARLADTTTEVRRLRAELKQARRKVCVIVTCEGCGETFQQDDSTCHFSTLDEAKSIATNEDWRFIGDQAYCGMCCMEAHAFVAGEGDITCERCDLEEDDHEQAQVGTSASRATQHN